VSLLVVWLLASVVAAVVAAVIVAVVVRLLAAVLATVIVWLLAAVALSMFLLPVPVLMAVSLLIPPRLATLIHVHLEEIYLIQE